MQVHARILENLADRPAMVRRNPPTRFREGDHILFAYAVSFALSHMWGYNCVDPTFWLIVTLLSRHT